MTANDSGNVLPFHRDYNRIFDTGFAGWPDNPEGYTFLGDLVHEACHWLFPEFQAFHKLPRSLFSMTAEQLRRDAIARRIVVGSFEGGEFVAINQDLLLAHSWQLLFRCCRLPSAGLDAANLFVRDQELDSYVSFLDDFLASSAVD
jgi:hypothetical protein